MDRFETFSGSILELNRYLQKLKDAEMKRLGLRGSHTMVLYYLGKHSEGLTPTELVDACREDKAAISRTLSQLMERGYVTGSAPEHKRAYRSKIMLTDSGRELVKTIEDRIDAAMSYGSDGLTQEQREHFYAAMEIIIHNLSRYTDAAKEL